jgi:hypothetical protein
MASVKSIAHKVPDHVECRSTIFHDGFKNTTPKPLRSSTEKEIIAIHNIILSKYNNSVAAMGGLICVQTTTSIVINPPRGS